MHEHQTQKKKENIDCSYHSHMPTTNKRWQPYWGHRALWWQGWRNIPWSDVKIPPFQLALVVSEKCNPGSSPLVTPPFGLCQESPSLAWALGRDKDQRGGDSKHTRQSIHCSKGSDTHPSQRSEEGRLLPTEMHPDSQPSQRSRYVP